MPSKSVIACSSFIVIVIFAGHRLLYCDGTLAYQSPAGVNPKKINVISFDKNMTTMTRTINSINLKPLAFGVGINHVIFQERMSLKDTAAPSTITIFDYQHSKFTPLDFHVLQSAGSATLPSVFDIIHPSVSRGGSQIAFALLHDTGFGHYSMSIYAIDNKKLKICEVVTSESVCEWPVFSPDERFIAFYRAPMSIYKEPGFGASYDASGHVLCVVPREGGTIRTLNPPPNTIQSRLLNPPAWSPDGKSILFEAQYNDPGIKGERFRPPSIYIAFLEDGKIARIIPPEFWKQSGSPSWAPDGKRFACHIFGELSIMDVETKKITQIKANRFLHCRWSPDGEWIAYATNEDGLCIISPDGRFRHKLAADASATSEFEWLR
ncbi:MAG: hypothetical protein NTX50_17720 [Candidatus Sumerlaeota bacterium]|nr:hypothetical protein [Candidatus Sumerlaeota bacterium]